MIPLPGFVSTLNPALSRSARATGALSFGETSPPLPRSGPRGLVAGDSGPGREDGVADRGVALDQHPEADLFQHGGDPGVQLADPQRPAGTVEPQVVRDQDADGPSRNL